MTRPTTQAASRAVCIPSTARIGRHNSVMPRKNASPATATGTPAITDQELVVTFRQSTTPVAEQARVVDPVKCSNERYADRATPTRASTNEAIDGRRVAGDVPVSPAAP